MSLEIRTTDDDPVVAEERGREEVERMDGVVGRRMVMMSGGGGGGEGSGAQEGVRADVIEPSDVLIKFSYQQPPTNPHIPIYLLHNYNLESFRAIAYGSHLRLSPRPPLAVIEQINGSRGT